MEEIASAGAQEEQILSYKSRLLFRRPASGKANTKSQKLFSFVKMAGSYGGISIHLEISLNLEL